MRRSLIPRGAALLIALIFVLHSAASVVLSPREDLAVPPALESLPDRLGSWKQIRQLALDRGVIEYLRPDTWLLRDYIADGGGEPINLFIAYFRSLKSSYGPHSPKVCLPGSGWLVRASREITFQPEGVKEATPARQFLLEKGKSRVLVLYWYQNERRVWADEMFAKLYMLPDLLRYHRFDVSLIRVVRSVANDFELQPAWRNGEQEVIEFSRILSTVMAEKQIISRKVEP